MTQAEKAKAYDKALERARKLYERGTITESLGHVFPELKESEDERIKREILDLVSIAGNGNQFEEIKDWLDKKIVVNNITMDEYNENVKALMPELAESDDERIRKGITELVKQSSEILDKKNQERMLNWLEKQKVTDEEIIFRPVVGTDIRIAAKQALEKIDIGKKVVLAFNGAYILVNGKTVGEIDGEYDAWLEKQNKHKEYTFKSIPRLLDMIEPTERAKAYTKKLINTLTEEGYITDAKIVEECLKQMNGEDVAIAVMDEKQSGNLVENGYTNNKDIIKYANNYSHEIWHKLMDNFKNIKDYHIGCNDVSDIVLNAIIDAYNWIEKQGEQKSQKVLTWKHWENGIAGSGEGEDTFLIKWSPWHYSVSSCLGSECDYIELSELDELLRKPNFETKEVTGTLKEMDPVELEETRKEMMESMPTDEEVQKLHDHLEMHKQLPKSEPQTITFIDSGTERIVDKLLMLEISVDAINQLQIKEHQRLFEALNEIIGKLGDLYEVLSKPYVFPYRDYTPPSPVPGMDVWYKTHGVEKVPPVTCETTTVCKPETISFDADLQKGSDYDIDN